MKATKIKLYNKNDLMKMTVSKQNHEKMKSKETQVHTKTEWPDICV